MTRLIVDQPPCEYCGKIWRVAGDADSPTCQLCKAINAALRRRQHIVCIRCGEVVPERGKSKLCPGCSEKRRPRYANACERCGKSCKGTRCSKCTLIIPCSCGCGVEAHLSSSDYGKPGATARSNKCLTRGMLPAASSGICEDCGTLFVPYREKRGRPAQRFCSIKCSSAHAVRTTSKQDNTHTCKTCGEVFRRRKSGGPYVAKFCSRPCADEAKRTGRKRSRPPKPPKPPRSRVYFPTCEMCGRLFCARSSRSRLCSAQCKIDDAGMRVKGLYAAATEFVDGQYFGAEWRQTLLRYLVERDGDRCGICRRRVDITLKSGTRGSRRGPSVDHIVPRSLGGSDDLANLRLTHWGCNQKRGNRGGNEQLALVG